MLRVDPKQCGRNSRSFGILTGASARPNQRLARRVQGLQTSLQAACDKLVSLDRTLKNRRTGTTDVGMPILSDPTRDRRHFGSFEKPVLIGPLPSETRGAQSRPGDIPRGHRPTRAAHPPPDCSGVVFHPPLTRSQRPNAGVLPLIAATRAGTGWSATRTGNGDSCPTRPP